MYSEDIGRLILGWRLSPVDFVQKGLGVEVVEEWQKDLIEGIRSGDARVAIKSGHGVGKSAVLSWVVLWWILCHTPAKVACTAPSAHQLKDILWGEIGIWSRRFKERTGFDWFEMRGDEVECTLWGKESMAYARTARKENPEAFQGFHSPWMLFIGDEASGIDDSIFEAGRGAMSTRGARIILAGNPTKASGYFYECFAKRNNWKKVTVSGYDSKRVDPKFIEECEADYGRDSNFFKVRVLGEFPETGEMQFISSDSVDACFRFEAEAWDRFPVQFGLDIARHGDDSSVLCIRQGRKVHEIESYKISDLVTLSGKVAEKIKAWKPEQVAIDVVGMGWGVYDLLGKWGYSDILQTVQGGNKSAEELKYVNKRAEMWDKMRIAIKEGIELPEDEDLKYELVGPQYDYDAKMRLMLEKKSSMKARGLSSPDMADALALTYAYELNVDVSEKEYVNFIDVGVPSGGYFKGYI